MVSVAGSHQASSFNHQLRINLGVYLDSTMSFENPGSETCKACYFHIRTLRHIRASLTPEASKTIAAAIVGSWLDFCNSLLAGCYNFSSHPILHLSSHDMYRREHSALHLCQYVFPHVKPPWQPPNHLHLLLWVSGMHAKSSVVHPNSFGF